MKHAFRQSGKKGSLSTVLSTVALSIPALNRSQGHERGGEDVMNTTGWARRRHATVDVTARKARQGIWQLFLIHI